MIDLENKVQTEKGENLFSQLFRPSNGASRKQKGPNIKVRVKVGLEQVYNGAVKKLSLKRKLIDREKGVQECEACHGHGMVATTVQTGNMTHRMQQPCPSCGGKGNITHMIISEEILNVYIDKGLPDGHRIVFPEKGDEIPGVTPGDVIVIVENKLHEFFRRDKADLIYRRSISLCEALTGVSFDLVHLDSRKLTIRMPDGAIAGPSIKKTWEQCVARNIEGHDAAVIEGVTNENIEQVKDLCIQNKWEGFVWDQKKGTGTTKKLRREDCKAKSVTNPETILFVAPEMAHIKIVRDEGLPVHQNGILNGNLIIEFDITFPLSLTLRQQTLIKNAFGDGSREDKGPTCIQEEEEVKTIEIVPESEASSASFDRLYDQDEDQSTASRGPTGAQCAQQ